VGRGRGRRRGSPGRAEGRVRGRVRERVQGRSPRRGEASTGRGRGTFDVDAIEGYANRLKGQLGGGSGLRGGSGLGGGSGWSGAASGLAGAASGLAGGSLASRLTGGRSESSEDFESEVRERLDLIEERLQGLEDEMSRFLEGAGATEDPQDLAGEPEPGTGP
jgi:hypothetical protein